jgi:manganese/zinc/iron transport system permease protein
MISYNTLVVLLGTGLLGLAAGLVGTFAVLRQRALVGDALAHAALPGLCLAFLVVGERSLPAMLLGALFTGVVGVLIIAVLVRWTRIKEDASIGIVLSVFFGAGIALSGFIQKQIASGNKAGLDSFIFGKTSGMLAEDVYLIGGLALMILVVTLLLYKEFRVTAFDPDFARGQGWPTLLLDLVLMGLIAVVVVAGLPAVGALLVSALLILPAAAARFWTDRLGVMLLLSALFGVAVSVSGTLVSAAHRIATTGPVIVLAGGILLLTSVLFGLKRGGIARFLELRRFRRELLLQKGRTP